MSRRESLLAGKKEKLDKILQKNNMLRKKKML